MVVFRKGLDLKIEAVFLDPEGESIVLDVNGSDSGAFKVVAVYAPTGAGWSVYFKCLEVSLETSRILVSVRDSNFALDGRFGCVGVSDRRGECKSLKTLPRRFHLFDRCQFGLGHTTSRHLDCI